MKKSPSAARAIACAATLLSFTSHPSPAQSASERPNEVTCQIDSLHFIQFKPQFGEIHFLYANGQEWKEHEDSYVFTESIRNTSPRTVNVRITDRSDYARYENELVGEWNYVEGQSYFSASYRGKVYTTCWKTTNESPL